MTTRFLTLMCLSMLALPLLAQDDPETQAATARWMKHMTPGVAHKHLAEMTGKWKTHNSMWMAPETPAMESDGTCENTMVMGGRYQRSSYAGNMMGMVFEGENLAAFDNKKQAFQATWIDNMGTSISMMEGGYDEATHTITYKGNMYEPMADKYVDIKMIVRYESKDRYVMEMFMPGPAGEFKMMEVVHTRAQ